jgi:hypothetical protein
MKIRFWFLIALGVFIILFQPIGTSPLLGLFCIAGGAFWLWAYNKRE